MGARVRLCGRLEVDWDGERLEPAFPGRQVRLLFAYLTLHRDRPVRRDELVEALWSGAPPSDGDALLRPLLSRLRRALGPDRLDGRAELALRFPADTWIDCEAIRAGLGRARERAAAGDHRAAWATAREALALAGREVLPGLDAPFIDRARTELEDARLELLETVARAGARLGDAELAEAEGAARRAVQLSPYRESARAALIEILRRRGNVAEALVAYDDVRRFLRDELGSGPGPELRALHAALLDGEAGPPVRAAAAGGTPVPDRLAQAAAASWIGRGDTLARLRAAAAQAAGGTTALVFVTGDGGIGKTRLVAELASGLPEFDVLYGRCDEEQQFPYGPWVEALRPRLARLADEELAALLGAGAADLARLLPEIRERLHGVASAPGHGDPETERRELFGAIAQTLARLAARRPVLAVIDDLHWADRSSLLLWRHLAGEPALGAVLLVGTFRDTELHPGHPLPELLADLERHRELPRIALAGMDEGEVGALIGSVHDAEVDGGTVRAIRTETDGNPFFVKQLVRHLEEVSDDGLGAFDGSAVPQTVRDVIVRRVSRLPADAGPVLRVAALLGRDFDFDLLAEVVELDEDPLLDVLDAAVRGGLLVEVPSTPGRYSFAHALLRTTLEGELSRTRRARLHARIGAAIEGRHAGRLDPWLDELARHFGAAGPSEAARAVEYAVRAADQATRRVAYDEAVRLLGQAVEARRSEEAADPAALARLECALAGAEARAGRWRSAIESFARSAEAARAAGDAEAFALAALGHSGGTWDHWGRVDDASTGVLEEALERLGPADSALRVQVLARLAVMRYYGDVPKEQMVRPAADALAMARRVGDHEALMAALVAELFARWGPGSAPARLDLTDELVWLTEAAGAPLAAAEAHLWRVTTLLELCRLEEVDASLARHEELVQPLAQIPALVHRDSVRVTRAVLEGDYAAGAAAAEALLARGDREHADGRTSTAITLSLYIAAMMSLLTEQGGFGRMVPDIEQVALEQPRLPGWRVMRAWADLRAGDRDRARSTVEDLLADDFRALPRDVNFVPTLALLAHIADELGDLELAAGLEPLLEPHSRFWVVFGIAASTLGPVAYSVGLVRLVLGRAEDAIASFELALERSHTMRARPYVARSQAGLAAALRLRGAPGDADRAAELEAQARDAARELGMLRLERELAGTPHGA